MVNDEVTGSQVGVDRIRQRHIPFFIVFLETPVSIGCIIEAFEREL